MSATWPVGGEGGWDCLVADPASHRLFVSHATRVVVLDTRTGKQVGEIPDTPGVHAIALAPESGKGLTSVGRANSVAAFDLATLRTLGSIKAGANPDVMLYEPSTRRIWAFNGRSNDATVINPDDLSVAGTVPLPGKPEFAVADGKGAVYVNLEDTSQIARIDARALKVDRQWPLAPGEGPSGLAFDPPHRRLFAACDNQVMIVMDADSGKVIATPPIGKGPDGAAFDPADGYAFSPNGRDGTLTVISTREPGGAFEVIQTLQTAPGARTMALDSSTHAIYLPTAEFEPLKSGERRPTPKPNTFKIIVVEPSHASRP